MGGRYGLCGKGVDALRLGRFYLVQMSKFSYNLCAPLVSMGMQQIDMNAIRISIADK
jgi:hypothetical protein